MAEKNKGGRPFALTANEDTLNIIKGLGNIQATTKECAAVLGVSEPTWITFKKREDVARAYIDGSGEGLASLRRRQFKAANDGNPTMLIWLGKQYLGQADKNEFTGKNGGPIQTVDLTNVSDKELAALEALFGPLAGAASDDDEGYPSGEGAA